MAQNQLSDTFSYSPPVAPDVSRAAYDAASGSRTDGYNYKPGWSPLGTTLGWWFNARKNRDYESWKLQKENEYNRALAEWQTFMSSPAAQKTAFKDAGYNSNYADPSQMSPASPGTYQHTEVDPAKDNIMSLAQSIFSMISGIQSLQSGALDIKHKEIENEYLGEFLTGRNSNQRIQGALGQQSLDNAQMQWLKLVGSLFSGDDIQRFIDESISGTAFWSSKDRKEGNMSDWSLSEALMRGPFTKGLDLNNQKIDEMIEQLGLKNLIDQPLADMAGANAGMKVFGGVGLGLIRLILAIALKR